MKRKNEKNGSILDYSISILLMLILALSTYLAPFAYSNFSDNKDMREELAAILPNYPQNKVWYILKEVSELQHRLTANVNLRLQLEGFFIRIL